MLTAQGDPVLTHEERLAEFRTKLFQYRLTHLPIHMFAKIRTSRSWAQGVPRGRSEAECLTQAVYYEARGEPAIGQAAVAQVALNRAKAPGFPKTVCDVVFQGAGRPGCQFSFACEGATQGGALNPAAWSAAQRVANEALGGVSISEVGPATHYHTDQVAPRWDATLSKIAKIGRHIFFGKPTEAPARTSPAERTWTSMIWG